MTGARGPRWLIIIQQDQPERYPAARERLFIVDRRRTERRRTRAPVETDWRRADRRQPLTLQEREQWYGSGYRVVYRAEGVPVDQAEDEAASWPSL